MPGKKQTEGEEADGAQEPTSASVEPQEPQAEVAYTYLPDKNPSGGGYPGVPLRNLLAHEVEQYPRWIQNNLKKSDIYASTAPTEGDGGDK